MTTSPLRSFPMSKGLLLDTREHALAVDDCQDNEYDPRGYLVNRCVA